MINPAIITTWHAEHVLGRADRYHDQGTISIDGTDVDWWSDGSVVWFYEPGKSGEDTIKRFESRRSVYEA